MHWVGHLSKGSVEIAAFFQKKNLLLVEAFNFLFFTFPSKDSEFFSNGSVLAFVYPDMVNLVEFILA